MKRIVILVILSFILFIKVSAQENTPPPYNLSASVDQTTGLVELGWNHLETDQDFNENFADGVADNWIPFDESWNVSSSRFQMEIPGYPDGLRVNSAYYMGEYSNFEYEVKIRKTNGVFTCGAGIYFNGDPSSIQESGDWYNGYRIFFCYESQKWNLFRFVNSQSFELQPFVESADLNPIIGDWNVLKVVFSNGTMDIYINGVLQGTYFDDTYPSGKVGVMAYEFGSQGNGAAEVDYAQLSSVKNGYQFGVVKQPEFVNIYSSIDEGINCDCVEPELIGMEKSNLPPYNGKYIHTDNKNDKAFSEFEIFRGGVSIGTSINTVFSETLSETGTFEYVVKANYGGASSEGISANIFYNGASNHFIPSWSGEPTNPMTMYITEAILNNKNLVPGDEIGVFDGANCVGVGVLSQEITPTSPLVILADDFTNGDVSFRYWDSSISAELTEVESSVLLGDEEFASNNFSVFKLTSGEVVDPSIQVLKPNGGEEIAIGQIYEITWSSVLIDNVLIQYSLDNGVTWSVIIESTDAASGSYMWSVPAVTASECLVLIADALDLNPFDVSDGTFSIVDPPLKITYPNGGEELEDGIDADITWVSDGITTLTIDYTTDNGTSWINISTGVDAATGLYVWNVPATFSDDCLVRLTEEGGANVDESDDLFRIVDVVSVDENNIGTPEVFKLSQNYPNPFNPSTTIKYQIPTEGFVTLKIYDMLGREIASLVEERQSNGHYSILWNSKENTSGIYMAKLTVADNAKILFQDIKKMVFLK